MKFMTGRGHHQHTAKRHILYGLFGAKGANVVYKLKLHSTPSISTRRKARRLDRLAWGLHR